MVRAKGEGESWEWWWWVGELKETEFFLLPPSFTRHQRNEATPSLHYLSLFSLTKLLDPKLYTQKPMQHLVENCDIRMLILLLIWWGDTKTRITIISNDYQDYRNHRNDTSIKKEISSSKNNSGISKTDIYRNEFSSIFGM